MITQALRLSWAAQHSERKILGDGVSGVPRVRTAFDRCRNYAGNEAADPSSPGSLALDVLVDVPLCVLVIRVENGRLLQLSLAIRIDFSSSLVIRYHADDAI
jgi:hypothetical protein